MKRSLSLIAALVMLAAPAVEALGATTQTSGHAQIISVTDRPIDDNEDGLYDRIGITPTANIFEAGTYIVSVVLRASNGNETPQSVEQTFALGTGSVEVSFSAEQILTNLAIDGPYTIAEVSFAEEVHGDLVTADVQNDLGLTLPYLLSQLQHLRLALNGTGDSIAAPVNTPPYRVLVVFLGVDADLAGAYSISVSLTDRNGRRLGTIAGSLPLQSGATRLEFDFPGTPIGQNAVDGPYFLSNFTMQGQGQSLNVPTAYMTKAFKASDFIGFVAPLDTIPPTVTISASPSVLWPVNHRMVEIDVHAVATDNLDPNPVVSFVSVTSNQGDGVRGAGQSSPDVSVDAAGNIFLRAERDATSNEDRVYTITYQARDFSGNVGTGSTTVVVPHDQRR